MTLVTAWAVTMSVNRSRVILRLDLAHYNEPVHPPTRFSGQGFYGFGSYCSPFGRPYRARKDSENGPLAVRSWLLSFAMINTDRVPASRSSDDLRHKTVVWRYFQKKYEKTDAASAGGACIHLSRLAGDTQVDLYCERKGLVIFKPITVSVPISTGRKARICAKRRQEVPKGSTLVAVTQCPPHFRIRSVKQTCKRSSLPITRRSTRPNIWWWLPSLGDST